MSDSFALDHQLTDIRKGQVAARVSVIQAAVGVVLDKAEDIVPTVICHVGLTTVVAKPVTSYNVYYVKSRIGSAKQ